MPSPLDALEATQRALPVSLIATPRPAFLTCQLDDDARQVVDAHPDIDHLPVVEITGDRERIIGLFDAYRFRDLEQGKPVRDCASPLSEGHLIGADAAILDFIKGAHAHSCRLLVSDTGISGLVTLSDLQDLPVRAALFSMVTRLEMAMAAVIRTEFAKGDGWMQRLSCGRQEKLEETIASARAGDAFVDALLFTQFCDKADIVRKAPGFEGIGFRADMKRAQTLRDSLAHANSYADSRDEAEQLCNTVRAIEKWIGALAAKGGT